MELFFKLGWYFKAQWRRYTAAILMLLGTDVLEMTVPWITGLLIDHVVADTLSRDLLMRYVGIVVIIGFVVYVMRYLWRVLLVYASFQLAATMRHRL